MVSEERDSVYIIVLLYGTRRNTLASIHAPILRLRVPRRQGLWTPTKMGTWLDKSLRVTVQFGIEWSSLISIVQFSRVH